MTQPIQRGALLGMAIGASVISLSSILVRFADVPPTVAGFWRMAFGGSMLTIALVVLRQWQRPGWRDLAWMLPPALAFALDLFVWFRSIHDIGPGMATLLANLQVFLMAMAGVWMHRERLGVRFVLGLALAIAGLWLMVGLAWGGFDPIHRQGIWLGLLTALCYASYMLSFRYAQRQRSVLPSAQLLAIISLLCAAFLAGFAMLEDASFTIPNARSLWALIAMGLVGQCVGWVLIARSLPLLPTSVVGLLLLLQPALAFVLDVLLFHRLTLALEWIGLSLVLCGIFLGSLRRKPAEREGAVQPTLDAAE